MLNIFPQDRSASEIDAMQNEELLNKRRYTMLSNAENEEEGSEEIIEGA
jgi:hypothetical protein